MRLVLLSIVLPLTVGLAGCASATEDSSDWGTNPGVDEEAAPQAIQSKATEIVKLVQQLMELDHQRSQLAQGNQHTPENERKLQQLMTQIRQTVAALPGAAQWVATYVQANRQTLQVGFERALTSGQAREKLGTEQVRKLNEAVRRAGGVDKIILDLISVLHGRGGEAIDPIDLAQKTPKEFFFAIVATFAGAEAAIDSWPQVIMSMDGLLQAGYLH